MIFLSFWRDTGAAAAVEFAMLLPVYLFLLLGLVAYGIYFGASHSIPQMAADAARIAISGLSRGSVKRW